MKYISTTPQSEIENDLDMVRENILALPNHKILDQEYHDGMSEIYNDIVDPGTGDLNPQYINILTLKKEAWV